MRAGGQSWLWPSPPASTCPFFGAGSNKAYELNKGCSPICAGFGFNFGFVSLGTSCCQSFLCNFSAADSGPRVSTPLLCLGVLFSLWQALLRLYP